MTVHQPAPRAAAAEHCDPAADDDSTCAEYVDARGLLGAFASDLYLPSYRVMRRGPWAIRAVPMLAVRGYWGETYRISGAVILVGPSEAGAQAWMSIVPSEVESQQIGLRASRGHTVIFGLGMGWLAANVALRSEVERVTVVERDADVIALVRAAGVFDRLPADARGKITIEEADARAWRPSARVDTLQADIWRELVEPGKLDDVRRMHANVGAPALYFWGQELEIWRCACRRAQSSAPQLDRAAVQAIVAEDLRLPLIVQDTDAYADRIAAAARWWQPSASDWWRDPEADREAHVVQACPGLESR